MKVGVFTHNYPRFAGDFSGRFVEALSEQLARHGHQVTVLAPWDPAFARRPADHTVSLTLYRYAPRADWHGLGYMRTMQGDLRLRRSTYLTAPLLFLAGAVAALRYAAQERPDVLHAHWALPNGFFAALASRAFRIPLVVSIPGSDATVAAQNLAFGEMARFVFRQADLITANAESLREVAIANLGASPAKFELIPYGVDPAALSPSADGTSQLRAELKIPAEAVVILAVGRMVTKKGFDVLLRAVPLLAAHATPVHLLMVGEGDLWASWQGLARELGIAERVHWVGNVPADRMGTYYNACDISVMPAVSQPATGLAVAVLDAMSCAKPIVASMAAGNELAVRHGLNGYLVPEGDRAALAHALDALIADPQLRGRLGAAGRQLIDAELGWPQLARRYEAHFRRIAGQRRP